MSDGESYEHDDDSRIGRREQARDVSADVKDSSPRESQQTEKGHNDSGNVAESAEDAAGTGAVVNNPALSSGVDAVVAQLGLMESYQGLLPKPDYFNQYPPEVQERMCRWNDAWTVDESLRQNRLVDAEIKQSKQGMWLSALLFTLALVFSFVTFWQTGSPWSFGFLALPVVSMIVKIFTPIASRSSRNQYKPSSSQSKD